MITTNVNFGFLSKSYTLNGVAHINVVRHDISTCYERSLLSLSSDKFEMVVFIMRGKITNQFLFYWLQGI